MLNDYGELKMKTMRQKQTRRESLEEAFFNVAVGYVISVIACYLVLPRFGFDAGAIDSLAIGLVFTVISIVRSYVLRRFYEWGGIRRVLHK